jgi:hypothetical protein
MVIVRGLLFLALETWEMFGRYAEGICHIARVRTSGNVEVYCLKTFAIRAGVRTRW